MKKITFQNESFYIISTDELTSTTFPSLFLSDLKKRKRKFIEAMYNIWTGSICNLNTFNEIN